MMKSNRGKLAWTLAFLLSVHAAEAQNADPWTEYMTPSATHQILGKYAGDFVLEITMWMSADQEPVKVTVNSTHKMILGDRFLEMAQTGDMMGMEYQALTIIGFNTSSKTYALTTMTNMGTGILSLLGNGSTDAHIADLTGQMINPVNKKPMNIRQKISFTDSDSLLIENFDQDENGKERKSMQYKFTRKKR